MSGVLTTSGGLITDAARADMAVDSDAGESSDGLSSDSSFGVWEATTNLVTNGGLETTATGWSTNGTNTVARSTEQAKFGAASLKATYQDNVILAHCATGNLSAAVYTFSVWLYIPSSYSGTQLALQANSFAGASGTITRNADMSLRDQWQRVTVDITPAAGDVAGFLMVRDLGSAPDAGDFIYLDGAQIEAQPLATPYVETNGSTQTRAAGRVQAPIALVNETQAWVALRLRMGSAVGTRVGEEPRLWAIGAFGNDWMGVTHTVANWKIYRRTGGAGNALQTAASFAKGDIVTVIAAWTATELKLSVNGTAFVTQANTTIPTLAATLFEIGGEGNATTERIDSDVLWFACGTGTLTDAQAAAIHAFGNTDKAPEDFLVAAPDCAVTMVWYADDATYDDEIFTILDPGSDGYSRGLVPRLRVDIDFTNDPTDATRVWTDVTADVIEVSSRRGGRNHELQRTEAGTLRGLLKNGDGQYDSKNASGPYYPNVKRRRWIRVSARWDLAIERRWTGVIEKLKQRWPEGGKNALLEIEAVDTFKILNLSPIDGLTYPTQQTGERVADVLDDIGITGYSVEEGESEIPAPDEPFAEGSFALSHLLDVEQAENGLFFAEGDGSLTFQGRNYRLFNSGESLGVIGDEEGDIRYVEGELDLDDADFFNSVAITPAGGTAEVATDQDSIDADYEAHFNRSLLITSQTEAADAAYWLLQRFVADEPRVPRVELLGARDPSTWPLILSARNSDRFTWKRTNDAYTIERDVFVERVSDRIAPRELVWDVGLELSPAGAQSGWILGDEVYSVLDETTVPGY